jgi:hypothetical protein
VDEASRARARNDSLLTVRRGDAAVARARAQGAGATTDDLRDGDAQRDNAEQLARGNRYADAFARYDDAIASWRQAETTARTRAAQAAVAPPPAAPPPAPPPAAPPAPPSAEVVRQQLQQAVQAYARALETGNVELVRDAYPGLTPRQEQVWRDFFHFARDLKVTLVLGDDMRQTGDRADASVRGTISYQNTQERKLANQPLTFRAQFERGEAGWRIRTIQ